MEATDTTTFTAATAQFCRQNNVFRLHSSDPQHAAVLFTIQNLYADHGKVLLQLPENFSATVHCAAPGGLLASSVGTGKTAILLQQAIDTRHCGPTLVVVPNSLEGQWLCELRRMYGDRVMTKTTKKGAPAPGGILLWRCTTLCGFWGAPQHYDIVFTTYEFMAARVKELTQGTQFDAQQWCQVAPQYAAQHGLPTVFHDRRWHRIVFDEVGTALATHAKGHLWAFLNSIPTDHVWAITATPNLASQSMMDALRLQVSEFCLPGHDTAIFTAVMKDYLEIGWNASAILTRSFRVTTAVNRDAAAAMAIPVAARVVELTLSDAERKVVKFQGLQGLETCLACTDIDAFLAAHNVVGQNRVECLQDYWATKKADVEGQRDAAQQKLDTHQARADELTQVLHALPAGIPEVAKVQERLATVQGQVEGARAALKATLSSLQFLCGMHDALSQAPDQQTCPICFDNIEPGAVTVTPCGHVYCQTCIAPWVERQGRCPTCRAPVTSPGLTTIATGPAKVQQQEVRLQYSTKLDFVLSHLRHLLDTAPDDRMVLFCRHNVTLRKLRGILEGEGIACGHLLGSVHAKNSNLVKFKGFDTSRNVRVLLLNPQTSAAGLDLVQANHIIFMDPVGGSTLQQATGRCTRLGQTKAVNLTFLTVPEFESRPDVDSIMRSLNLQQAPSAS